MEIVNDNAPPAPSPEQIIEECGPKILSIMKSEEQDESDVDRIYILWKIHKNYIYYRGLQNDVASIYEGVADFSAAAGVNIDTLSDANNGSNDYNQNFYLGFCRKMEAVLGTRMPNAIAMPDNAADENDIRAASTANDAAEYVRSTCDLQSLVLQGVFGIYNFGTNFWHPEWVVDGEKNGYKEVPNVQSQPQQLGGAGFDCPQCGAAIPSDDGQKPAACPQCGGPLDGAQYRPPQVAQVPVQLPPTRVAKGSLEISLHDGSEVIVPLDSESINKNLPWLVRDYEWHKSLCLKKWGKQARQIIKDGAQTQEESTYSQLGRNIRSSFGSPIGIFRSYRENYWTVREVYWSTAMFELLDDEQREMMVQNFSKGCKMTVLKGKVVSMEDYDLPLHWQEIKPEPSKRIMAAPLGDDWTTAQDILTNTLNQSNEIIERSNDPGFADPTRLDFDAWERRHDSPGELFPLLPRAGQSIQDSIYRPPPVTFSEQIPRFREQVKQDAQENSGLTDAIWGGDSSDPTARQTELKTNAAIRTLSVYWKLMGKSLEQLYLKSCKILADSADGVLTFSRKDKFGVFQSVAVNTEDLKNGKYHFEADEAIPMTWGQQRDLMMWMLDKPAPLLTLWGFDSPINIPEFKRLLGMPGEHTPLMDDRDKGMAIIAELGKSAPMPGQPGPIDPMTGMPGSPGPPQASIPPDWEDDHAFMAHLAKDYLVMNYDMAKQSPDGMANIRAWGQAHEQMANQPAPPEPVRASLAVSLKGQDLGDPAVTAALGKAGVIPEGVQTTGDVARSAEMDMKAEALKAKQANGIGGGMPPPGLTQ